MKDIPIIFSGPMVRALLDGHKTMTRRLAGRYRKVTCKETGEVGYSGEQTEWVRVKPGDRLWVREKVHVRPIASAMHAYSYFDEEDPRILGGWKKVRLLPHDHKVKRPEHPIWRPSIHMPRDFSRLTLIVSAVKVERLQDISDEDAIAEGVQHRWLKSANCAPRPHYFIDAGNSIEHSGYCAKEAFERLWDALHGPKSWDANPEVVALTFAVHKANIDTLPKAEAA